MTRSDVEQMRAERDLALRALMSLLQAWHGIEKLPPKFAACFTAPLPTAPAPGQDLFELSAIEQKSGA